MIERFINKTDEQNASTKPVEDVLASQADSFQPRELEQVIIVGAARDSRIQQASPDISRVIRTLADREAARRV